MVAALPSSAKSTDAFGSLQSDFFSSIWPPRSVISEKSSQKICWVKLEGRGLDEQM